MTVQPDPLYPPTINHILIITMATKPMPNQASVIISNFYEMGGNGYTSRDLIRRYQESKAGDGSYSERPENIAAFQAIKALTCSLCDSGLRWGLNGREKQSREAILQFLQKTDDSAITWLLHMLTSLIGSENLRGWPKIAEFLREITALSALIIAAQRLRE